MASPRRHFAAVVCWIAGCSVGSALEGARDLTEILGDFRHPAARARRLAIGEALIRHAPNERQLLADNVGTLLDDVDAGVRAFAVDALATLARVDGTAGQSMFLPQPLLSSVVSRASDPVANVRAAALNVLASAGAKGADVLAVATARAKDANAQVREKAVAALGSCCASEVVSLLTQRLQADPDSNVRRRAAASLASVEPPSGTARRALERASIEDTDAAVRIEALHSLGRLGKGGHQTETLLAQLSRDEQLPAGIRVASIEALGRLRPLSNDIADGLIEISDDSGELPLVRTAALGSLGAAEPSERLIAHLERSLANPDTNVRQAAAGALRQSAGRIPAAASALMVAAERGNVVAIGGLAAVVGRDREVDRLLLLALRSQDVSARTMALGAIAQIGRWDGELAQLLALVAQSDGEQRVRDLANRTLRVLQSKREPK